tara:strand:+ start:12310 stop:12567 length:258 start_codon:yes stop_codon:yes gene_type:complete
MPLNKPTRVEPPLELRRALYELIQDYMHDDRAVGEVLMCAATACICVGMSPEQSNQAFNAVMADVYRSLEHMDMNPLAQVVKEEV